MTKIDIVNKIVTNYTIRSTSKSSTVLIAAQVKRGGKRIIILVEGRGNFTNYHRTTMGIYHCNTMRKRGKRAK